MSESNPKESELAAAEELLGKALGGWRGLLDSGLPTAVFLLVWTVTGNDLNVAVGAALAVAVVLAALRLVQRRSTQQVISGLIGVGVAAWFSHRTGKAEDFFLPGLLTNLAYAAGIALSIAIKHPAVGYVIGALQGDFGGWRADPKLLAKYRLISWWWVGMFSLRLLVQVPLYLAGLTQLLGTAKLIMGWPLYLATAYVTYRAVVGNAEPAVDDAVD